MNTTIVEVILQGYSIAPGIAIGTPCFISRCQHPINEQIIPAEDIDKEIKRYQIALKGVKEEIEEQLTQAEAIGDSLSSSILMTQIDMLNDPLLTTAIEHAIHFHRTNAECVLNQSVQQYKKRFMILKNNFFMDRFKDFENLSCRILMYLQYPKHKSLSQEIPQGCILCVHELTASDAARATNGTIQGFLSSAGGCTTHAAIIAKGRGIPFITNISLDVLKELNVRTMILDGLSGKIILNPRAETLFFYQTMKIAFHNEQKKLQQKQLAQTYDGYLVRLYTNIDTLEEIDLTLAYGAAGVGLLRSEYFFHDYETFPSEEEQYAAYCDLIAKMGSLPLTIRTFDFEGDKKLFMQPASPFSITYEKLLQIQLKAIVRASTKGQIRILFPMITSLEELKKHKAYLQQAQEEVQLFHPISIGCMIEIPSAAITMDSLIKECHFFSIGTNDLAQYTLGTNRRTHQKPHSCESLDPSVIRLIKWVVKEADNAKIPICICGESASNAFLIPLLIGLGVQELSVSPRFLSVVTETIRRTSIVEAVDLAQKALTLETLEEVGSLLKTHVN